MHVPSTQPSFHQPTLLLIIYGLPGSGKSTLAWQLADSLREATGEGNKGPSRLTTASTSSTSTASSAPQRARATVAEVIEADAALQDVLLARARSSVPLDASDGVTGGCGAANGNTTTYTTSTSNDHDSTTDYPLMRFMDGTSFREAADVFAKRVRDALLGGWRGATRRRGVGTPSGGEGCEEKETEMEMTERGTADSSRTVDTPSYPSATSTTIRIVIAVDNMPFASTRLGFWRMVRDANGARLASSDPSSTRGWRSSHNDDGVGAVAENTTAVSAAAVVTTGETFRQVECHAADYIEGVIKDSSLQQQSSGAAGGTEWAERSASHQRVTDPRSVPLIGFAQIFVDEPLAVCLERNEGRRQRHRGATGGGGLSAPLSSSTSSVVLDPYIPPATITAMASAMDGGGIPRAAVPFIRYTTTASGGTNDTASIGAEGGGDVGTRSIDLSAANAAEVLEEDNNKHTADNLTEVVQILKKLIERIESDTECTSHNDAGEGGWRKRRGLFPLPSPPAIPAHEEASDGNSAPTSPHARPPPSQQSSSLSYVHHFDVAVRKVVNAIMVAAAAGEGVARGGGRGELGNLQTAKTAISEQKGNGGGGPATPPVALLGKRLAEERKQLLKSVREREKRMPLTLVVGHTTVTSDGRRGAGEGSHCYGGGGLVVAEMAERAQQEAEEAASTLFRTAFPSHV